MISPWNSLAWTVFIVSFVIPFFVLLNKNIKTKPRFMIVLSSVVLLGIWLEHLLLLAPALTPSVASLPLNLADGLITLGFFGLMALAITYFLRLFPELVPIEKREVG
jgi:uncharacterized membrane protein YwaF